MSDIESDTEDIQLTTTRNPDVVTKYKAAGEIAQKALNAVSDACVAGAKILDLCALGDKTIEEGAAGVYRGKGKDGSKIEKGIAFPTCISVNNCACHYSPLPSDKEVLLADGDLVKIELGVHIDGYPALVGTTIVVGATKEAPATGRKADVMQAAHLASEAALRLVRPGKKSSEVVETVNKIVSSFNCHTVEGFSSHEIQRNTIDGEKVIVFAPTESQKKDVKDVEFEEHDVFGIDILVSSGDGKTKQLEARTTVYKKTNVTYLLKMKTSRATFSEVTQKFGSMAFSLRSLEDEKKSRMGIIECVKHGLVTPYDVYFEKEGEFVALFKFTVILLPSGPSRLTSSTFNADLVKSEHKVEDQEIVQLLSSAVATKKANKKKKGGKESEASSAAGEAPKA